MPFEKLEKYIGTKNFQKTKSANKAQTDKTMSIRLLRTFHDALSAYVQEKIYVLETSRLLKRTRVRAR